MGAEAACKAVIDGRAAAGKALLETREILFRGDGLRVVVPFAEITAIDAGDGMLDVRWGQRRMRLELGDAAPKWLKKIKNPPSLLDKLGVKAGHEVGLVGLADEAFRAELDGRGARIGPPRAGCDVLFLGAEKREDLDKLGKLRGLLDPAGAIWVVRPKGRKEITEADVMAAGKAAGLVDVKVAAFSATHTAEKYVIPVANRKGSARTTR